MSGEQGGSGSRSDYPWRTGTCAPPPQGQGSWRSGQASGSGVPQQASSSTINQGQGRAPGPQHYNQYSSGIQSYQHSVPQQAGHQQQCYQVENQRYCCQPHAATSNQPRSAGDVGTQFRWYDSAGPSYQAQPATHPGPSRVGNYVPLVPYNYGPQQQATWTQQHAWQLLQQVQQSSPLVFQQFMETRGVAPYIAGVPTPQETASRSSQDQQLFNMQWAMCSHVVSPDPVLAFWKDWRALECECCCNLIGFQNRKTGAIRCTANISHSTAASPCDALVRSVGDAVDGRPPKLPGQPIMTATEAIQVAPDLEAPKPVLEAPVTIVDAPAPKAVPAAPVTKEEVPIAAPAASAPKPVEPKPTPVAASAPTAPAPKLYSAMKFSPNVIAPGALVRPVFAWSPVRYTIAADADEGKLAELQEAVDAYVASATSGHKPVEDEVVIGQYDGAFYRARVSKIIGDKVKLIFIDYGDSMDCSVTDIYAVNDALYNHPVYGMIVNLKVQVDASGVKMNPALEEILYIDDPFSLELNPKQAAPQLQPRDAEPIIRLWYRADGEKKTNLNEKMTEAISRVKN